MRNVLKFIIFAGLLGGAVSCQDWASDIKAVNERVDSLSLATNASYKSLNDRVTILENDVIPAIGAVVAVNTALITEVSNSVDTLNKQTEALEDANKKFQEDLNVLGASLDEQKKAVEVIETAYKDADKKTYDEACAYADEVGLRVSTELSTVANHVDDLEKRVTSIENTLVLFGDKFSALDEQLVLVSDKISALDSAILKINKTVEALASQIQSITFVPEYESALGKVYVPINTFTYAAPNDTVFTSDPKFEAVFRVEPANFVSSLSLDNVHVYAHTVATKGMVDEYELPFEITTYPERGQMQINCVISKDSLFYNVFMETGKLAFNVVIDQANEQEEALDCGTHLSSSYVSGELVSVSEENSFRYVFYDGKEYGLTGTDTVEVPWDSWKSSTRYVFNTRTLKFKMGEKYYTPSETAEILGVSVRSITPMPDVTFDYNKSDYVVKASGWNSIAKINLDNIVTEGAAKALVNGNNVKATMKFYMMKGDVKYYLNDVKYESTYKIVNSTADVTTISDIVLNWNYTMPDYVVNEEVKGLTSDNLSRSLAPGYVYDNTGKRLETSDATHYCIIAPDGPNKLKAHVSGIAFDSVENTYYFKGSATVDKTDYPTTSKIVVPAVPSKTQSITLAEVSASAVDSSIAVISKAFNGSESKYIGNTEYSVNDLYATFASDMLITAIENVDDKSYSRMIPTSAITVTKNGDSINASECISELKINFYQKVKDGGFVDNSFISFINPADDDVYIVKFSVPTYWGITYNFSVKVTYSDPE